MSATVRALGEAMAGAVPFSQDAAQCALFGEDIFHAGPPVAAVAAPRTTADAQKLVRAARSFDLDFTVRGGGASYSGGYLPVRPEATVAIDLSALNRIEHIDAQNMVALVEAGCTWSELDKALSAQGLRAAWWGPMSGRHATIGGALSQNAIFWGSGEAGFAADTVLGLEVLIMTGEIIRTGSLALPGALPFSRYHGPDLTGPFLGDSGSLGIKLRAAIRLIRRRPYQAGLSFAFKTFEGLAAFLSETARHSIAAQVVGFDRGLVRERVTAISKSDQLSQALVMLRQAWKRPSRLVDLTRIALSRQVTLGACHWTGHVFIEDHSPGGAKERKMVVRRIAYQHGGDEIPPAIPTALAASPFPPLSGLVGPNGERWVPVHCVVPHSLAGKAQSAIDDILMNHSTWMERLAIRNSTLYSTAGAGAFIIEPMFFWADDAGRFHRSVLSAGRLGRMQGNEHSAEARALVETMRQEIAEATDALGATHIQIGANYSWATRIEPATRTLHAVLKRELDPEGRLNPSALRR